MLRSMFSGISGMKNFQTKLDVIGNNIANVNTAGYKKSRVTFKDTMNQMVAGASAATENRGGKNPTQVGLGSTLATIDTIHTGSSLQTTNRPLDLGIDGDGYFVVKQGDAQFYTRAGNFYLDDNGSLVNADGLKVQAYKYDNKGNLTNVYGDVTVNVNAVLPPVTTKELNFQENLSSDANIGTTFEQQIKVVDKNGVERQIGIYFKKLANDKWGVYANKTPQPASAIPSGGLKITNPAAYTGDSSGKWDLEYTGTSGSEYNLKIGSDTIPLKLVKATKKLAVVNPADLKKLKGIELDVSGIEKPPSASIEQIAGSSGNIKITDPTKYTGTTDKNYTITFSAGDSTATPPTTDRYDMSIDGAAATAITFDSTTKKYTQDGIEFDINSLSPSNGDTWSIDVKAKAPQVLSPIPPATTVPPIASVEVIPATKADHTLDFVSGKIPNGKTSITMDIPIPSGLKDDTETVADESLQILKGINFDFSSLTQEEGPMTALVNPDGNTEGKLESMSVGSSGDISGVYSNGLIKSLGRIAIAKFSNSSGLTKAGNSLFQETVNSGTPNINVAGDGRGTIASGQLEMSNVDLSEEFTEMITAQRGFQANTRIITTSDEILQELVNLKR